MFLCSLFFYLKLCCICLHCCFAISKIFVYTKSSCNTDPEQIAAVLTCTKLAETDSLETAHIPEDRAMPTVTGPSQN